LPRYHFHLTLGETTIPDEVGVELESAESAREAMLSVVADLASTRDAGEAVRSATISIVDERGRSILKTQLPLSARVVKWALEPIHAH
jgi:hypothetical protein